MTAQPSEWFAALQEKITRRTALASLGAAGVVTFLREPRPAAREAAEVAHILVPLATLEAFLTTFLGAARERAERLKFSDEQTRLLRAAQCEDEAHYHNLIALGIQATTTRFTLSGSHYRDRGAFFASFEQVKHLALGRLLSGERLPANRAFARWQFHTTAEVLTALEEAAFINGRGGKFDFPGPVSRNCRGIFGLVAETTEDQPPATPRAPEASPVRRESGTPDASTPVPAEQA